MISGELEPIFYNDGDYSIGWSSTSIGTFQRCQRQFYFEKVKPKWLELPPVMMREVTQLRSLTSLPIIVGETIHWSIANYLRAFQCGNELSEDDYSQAGIDYFDQQISDRKLYERVKGPENFEENVGFNKQRTKTLLSVFWDLPERKDIAISVTERMSDSFIDHDGSGPFYGEFRVAKFKAYGAPDLVYSDNNGRFHVISWKTGIPDDDGFMMQLAAQLLFCIHNFGLSPDILDGKVLNLNRIDEPAIEIAANSPILGRVLTRMQREVEELTSMYDDPKLRIPKPMELFELTMDQNDCTRCKYRDICDGPE